MVYRLVASTVMIFVCKPRCYFIKDLAENLVGLGVDGIKLSSSRLAGISVGPIVGRVEVKLLGTSAAVRSK
jgi:hypothetical protein